MNAFKNCPFSIFDKINIQLKLFSMWTNYIFFHLLQNILKKFANSTGECSNRTELLTAAWSNLYKLIEIDDEQLEKWTQYVVKCTLESMLTVR